MVAKTHGVKVGDESARSSRADKTAQTRDAIVATALNLFRRKGYSRTTMSEIARGVELNPSSLHYYFPSKSALLADVFDYNRVPDPLAVLQRAVSTRAAQLYALVVFDAVVKCELPFDFVELESVAYEDPQRFEVFFQRYRSMYQSFVEVLRSGRAEGEFFVCDAEEMTVVALSSNEGLQHHYHAKHRNELILAVSGYEARNYSPEEIGHMSAASFMPQILGPDINFNEVKQEGMRLYAHLVHAQRAR